MKSQLTSMFEIWSYALFDAQLACDLLHREVVRDNRTAERSVETRGIGFFTLDLPSLDSNLLELLEHGRVRFKGPFTGRRSKSDLRPKFLWDLWRQVCNEAGVLLEHPSPDAIAALRQLSCFYKKLEIPCADSRKDESIQEFYAIESQIRVPTARWTADDFGNDSCRSLGDIVNDDRVSPDLFGSGDGPLQTLARTGFVRRFDRIAGLLVSRMGPFDSMSGDSPETGFFKHGPGAVSNLRGMEYKYSFPFWSEKLEGVFPFDWCSGAPVGSYPDSRQEKPARLLAVPKTAKGPRLIAAEPVEHQWCQQKIATWLSSAYRRTTVGSFIALHDQTLSQSLVVSASLDRSLSTIDLSSASDRISTWLIEALFRSNLDLLRAMHAVRSRWIEDGETGRGFHKLRKFSTQGSALTFPVQSLLFLTIALAVCTDGSHEGIESMKGKVRVFGDDIIIPIDFHEPMVRALTALGLKVSEKKSFHHGEFRESCGADYWRGYDVTPVKPKRIIADAPVSAQAVLDTANNLFQKGWWHVANRVSRELPSWISRGLVTRFGTGVAALQCFSGDYISPDLIVWNDALQKSEVRIETLRSVSETRKQHSHLALREFLTRPYSAERPRETGVRVARSSKWKKGRVALI